MRKNGATAIPQFDAPLPVSADPSHVDKWELFDKGFYRLVWSNPIPLPAELAQQHHIRVVCTQLPNGEVVSDDPEQEGPFIYFGDQDYRAAATRALVQALLVAADLADEWAG